MKIIYIANTQMPTDRAHGYQITKTCEKFAALGNEVSLWVPDRTHNLGSDIFGYYGLKKNFTIEKIPCFNVMALRHAGKLPFYAELVIFSVKLLCKEVEKNSIIYSRDILSIFVFRIRGFRVVYNVHNWTEKRSRLLKIFFGKEVKIVCNSEGTRKRVVKDGFNNSITAQNGVELSDFEHLEEKPSLRKKLELPLDKKIILYAGHLYGWKGADTILKTAKLLGGEQDIFFVVVGGGTEEQKIFAAKMKEGGIFNMLSVGHKLKKEIPQYLQSADILLLPNSAKSEESVKYTSPIKMFEYMASGVPIIASDLPSLREVLSEENALLIEPDNPQALAESIEKILNDTNLSSQIAQKAKDDVRKYTWDNYAEKILEFIQK
jgi:glycosyltransferase involved in cell wall biosynthesis